MSELEWLYDRRVWWFGHYSIEVDGEGVFNVLRQGQKIGQDCTLQSAKALAQQHAERADDDTG